MIGCNENFEFIGYDPAALDGILIFFCLVLIYTVSSPGYYTLQNIFYQTSEVIKFKEAKMEEMREK